MFPVLLVSAASSDPTPHWFQRDVVQRYARKALPCLLCWILIQRELWSGTAPGRLAGQGGESLTRMSATPGRDGQEEM